MTIKEAKIFFPYEEDFDDAWEQYFFEQKQFFIHKLPLRSVIENRFKKISKVQESYELISGINLPECPPVSLPHFKPNNSVLKTFHSLHQFRNECKQLLWSSEHPEQLKTILLHWANQELIYAECWRFSKIENSAEKVIISKEPDPMYLLASVKEFESRNNKVLQFTELEKQYIMLPETIQTEIKRLNLLLKQVNK